MQNILVVMNEDGHLRCSNADGGFIEEMKARRLVITLNDFFRSSVISYFTISFEPYGLGKKIVTDNIYKDGISDELYYSAENGTLVCPIYDYVSVSPRVSIQIDGYETDSNSDVCAIYKSGIMTLNFSNSLVGDKIVPEFKNGELKLSERISDMIEDELDGFVVTDENIADGAVVTQKIDDVAVTTSKIANEAVTAAKIANEAVRTAHLLNSSVTSAKLDNSSVKTNKIENAAVTEDKLASNAVSTLKIADNAVTNTKIAQDAVRSVHILSKAVTNDKIDDNAIRTNHINDGAITSGKISNACITTSKIDDAAVTNVKIADNAVRRNHLLDQAVSGKKILDGCISTSKLADASVTQEKLAPKMQALIKKNPTFINIDKQINYIAYSYVSGSGCTINTQEAYVYHCKHGYTSIKGDMRLTSDHKIIMCHDAGFTFDSNGKITTYNSENAEPILNNTYSYWMSKQYADGTGVCDFDTFIKTCKSYGKTPFITLRQENTLVTDAEDNEQKAAYIVNIKKMLEILDKYNMRDNCIVNCTNYTPLWELRNHFDATIPMAFSYGKITESDNKLRIDQASNENQLKGDCIVIGGINDDVSNLDYTFDDGDGNMVTAMEYARRKGLRFYCYFVGSTQDALAAIEKGVTGMQMTCAVPVELQASIPTKTSDLQNDSGFLTSHQDISGKEDASNKVTLIDSTSPSNTKYPSESAVVTYMNIVVGDINTQIDEINGTVI